MYKPEREQYYKKATEHIQQIHTKVGNRQI